MAFGGEGCHLCLFMAGMQLILRLEAIKEGNVPSEPAGLMRPTRRARAIDFVLAHWTHQMVLIRSGAAGNISWHFKGNAIKSIVDLDKWCRVQPVTNCCETLSLKGPGASMANAQQQQHKRTTWS